VFYLKPSTTWIKLIKKNSYKNKNTLKNTVGEKFLTKGVKSRPKVFKWRKETLKKVKTGKSIPCEENQSAVPLLFELRGLLSPD
jgi:hypothetical protein